MQEWQGPDRRRDGDRIAELAREIMALNETMLEMHRENVASGEQRWRRVEDQLTTITTSIHGLQLGTQGAIADLKSRLSVHEAGIHLGTQAILADHKTRLDGHDTAIGTLQSRLRVQDHHEERHRWGVGIWIGVGAIVAGVLGSVIQALGNLAQAAVALFDTISKRGS